MQSSRPPRKFERAIMDLLFQLNGQVRLKIAQKEESKKILRVKFSGVLQTKKATDRGKQTP
jgi:hypothetical protein